MCVCLYVWIPQYSTSFCSPSVSGPMHRGYTLSADNGILPPGMSLSFNHTNTCFVSLGLSLLGSQNNHCWFCIPCSASAYIKVLFAPSAGQYQNSMLSQLIPMQAALTMGSKLNTAQAYQLIIYYY